MLSEDLVDKPESVTPNHVLKELREENEVYWKHKVEINYTLF